MTEVGQHRRLSWGTLCYLLVLDSLVHTTACLNLPSLSDSKILCDILQASSSNNVPSLKGENGNILPLMLHLDEAH